MLEIDTLQPAVVTMKATDLEGDLTKKATYISCNISLSRDRRFPIQGLIVLT